MITCWWEQYHWWGTPIAWSAAGPCYPKRQHTACAIAHIIDSTDLDCLSPFWIANFHSVLLDHILHVADFTENTRKLCDINCMASTDPTRGCRFDCIVCDMIGKWFDDVRQQTEVPRKKGFRKLIGVCSAKRRLKISEYVLVRTPLRYL